MKWTKTTMHSIHDLPHLSAYDAESELKDSIEGHCYYYPFA